MLVVKIKQLPDTILGSYGKSGDEFPDLPSAHGFPGQRKLAPAAADSFMQFYADGFKLRVSDLLRSAESSIAAKTGGRGAQPPGFSGHNFGFSFDLDIEKTMKDLGYETNKIGKERFDNWMQSRGWWCHRTDHELNSESWHYNYFGMADGSGEVDPKYPQACVGHTSTNAGLQQLISDTYGDGFHLNNLGAQIALAKLGYYRGAIDGIIGHQSESAIGAFQNAYLVPVSYDLTPTTQRVLAFATCAYLVQPAN